MRKVLALGLVCLASGAQAHGGDPIVTGFRFPTFYEQPWIVVENTGLYMGAPESHTWLCEEAANPIGFLDLAPFDAQRWIAAGRVGIQRSEDGGCSFTAVEGELTEHVVTGILPHPAEPGEAVVRTVTIGPPNDVFITEDYGETWTAAGLQVTGRVRSLMRADSEPSRLYGSTASALVRSDDGGRSFVELTLGPADLMARADEVRVVAIHPEDPDEVVATIERFPDSFVIRSLDGGDSWETQATLPDAPSSMVIEPGGQRRIMATAFEGMFRSEDGGASWEPLASPADNFVLGCFQRAPDGRLWACGRGLIDATPWAVGSSDDLGETWRAELRAFSEFEEMWDCPADAPTTAICGEVCLPGDPNCGFDSALPQPDGGFDFGVEDAEVEAEASVEAGAAGEAGVEPDAPKEDDGCGCRAGDAGGAWLLLLLPLGLRRRR